MEETTDIHVIHTYSCIQKSEVHIHFEVGGAI